MKRRSLLRVGLLLPLSVMGGCFGGGGRAPHTWWVLEAPGAPGTAEPDSHRAKLSLVVEGVAAGALYDGTALVYSHGAGMRAPYLYASWSERPAVRIARLAQRRLQARGGFRDVTLAEAGVAPDLLLTLTLDRLDHDLVEGGEPESESGAQAGNGGELALALTATLVDWHARRPIAWRRFSAVEPVATANAAGAVAAAGRATEAVLAELAPWVEAAAAGLAPAASPGAGTAEAPGEGPVGPVKPAQARGNPAPAEPASPRKAPA
ncbi:MAG: ABC-type transport auxiliary lipoprotein family protein, partial [Gammaproteobacteria bacterium]